MRLARAKIIVTTEQANTLRRASLTLTRWAELECGDGNDHGSWAIERDENGEGAPFMVHHHYLHGKGKDYTTRRRIPDRERGALARVAKLCAELKLHFYHQTDPRGVALYVWGEPLTDQNYSSGVPIE
ncbi:MAG: hypothetical protein EBT13_17660 [Rhodobacteraceae bacterium]|nr:hypothetical protein [Paracoccaceae bacterium]